VEDRIKRLEKESDAGQIVGDFLDAAGEHGFLKVGATFTTIDGAFGSTLALGINDGGQIVGSSGAPPYGFLKDGPTFTTVDVPGAFFTQPSGINDTDQVVGGFAYAGGGDHGFVIDGAIFTTISGHSDMFEAATLPTKDITSDVGELDQGCSEEHGDVIRSDDENVLGFDEAGRRRVKALGRDGPGALRKDGPGEGRIRYSFRPRCSNRQRGCRSEAGAEVSERRCCPRTSTAMWS
jgi:hypothetical protein